MDFPALEPFETWRHSCFALRHSSFVIRPVRSQNELPRKLTHPGSEPARSFVSGSTGRSVCPSGCSAAPDAIFAFNKAIIDATHDIVCAYKPPSSRTTPPSPPRTSSRRPLTTSDRYPAVPVILDAKRGDVGNTAEFYAWGLRGATAPTR